MPKIVKKLSSQGVWFRPACLADDGSESDVALFLRPLTSGEYQQITSRAMQQAIAAGSANNDNLEVGASIVRDALQLCVLDTTGIYIDDGEGQPRRPRDGGDFYDVLCTASVADARIADEVYAAILDASLLKGGALGNSDGPPDSSTPQTMKAGEPNDGHAPSATDKTKKRKGSTRKK